MFGTAGLSSLVAAVSVLGLAQPLPAGYSPLKRPVQAFSSDHEPALAAILRFGKESKTALGVIVDDQLCCTTTAALRIPETTAEAAAAKLAHVLPSYHFDAEDGVIVFAPEKMPAPVTRFLAVVPPEYCIAEDGL